ncbi:MAG: peptidase domain-containing ABC transporter [Oligoflexales bacterium]
MTEEEKSKLAENHNHRISTSLYHCLIPLLRDIGWYGSKEQLNQILPMETFSINIDDVRNSLTALRIIAKTKFIRLNKINRSNLPCIFTTKEGNSIAIFEINEYGFSVFDGYTQKRQIIKPNWKIGTMLTFDLLDDNATTLQESQTKWFNKLIIRFQQMFGYSLFLSLAISVLTVSAPLFVMFLFREISALEVTSTLDQLAVGVAFYVLTLVGFRILRTINLAYFSARIGNIIANQVMRRLLYLPPTYTEMASLGGQLSRIRDFDSIKNFFSSSAMVALLEIPFVLLIILALFLIDPYLALIPLGALVVFAILGFFVRIWSRNLGGEFSGNSKEYNEFILGSFANLKIIKCLSISRHWQQKYGKLLAANLKHNHRNSSFFSMVSDFSNALVSIAGIGTVLVGVHRIFSGELTPGGLMASLMLTWRVLAPVKTGLGVLVQFDKVKSSIGQVNKLMELKTEKRSKDSVAVTTNIAGKIIFSRVSLRYAKESLPALLGVSFKVEPNETLVILGQDGSGSSTILKILMGMYLPQSGQVLIDDNNLKQMDPISIRHLAAYMPEKPFLIDATLRQNLLLNNSLAKDSDIKMVMQRAGLASDIDRLPQGLDTYFDHSNHRQFSYSLNSIRKCKNNLAVQNSKQICA